MFFLILSYIPRAWLILLLTAELIWITLFIALLAGAHYYNNIYLLAIALYAILLSALEFALGLLLAYFTNTFFYTTWVDSRETALAAPQTFLTNQKTNNISYM